MVHQYKNNGYDIVLDVNSGAIHVVDDVTYDVIEMYAARENVADASEEEIVTALSGKYGKEEVEEAIDEVQTLIKNEELFTKDTYENYMMDFKKRPTVVKALCLHIAHDCNLACRYCFAEEGEYHGRRALMSFETGKKALDFLIANSGNRRNLEVDFFGGEPLMNWQVVKDLVAYGREQEKIHNKNFRFTLTTNGVLLNDEIMEFANKEMGNVVLSIDGRKEVHDHMRPFRKGAGSYDLGYLMQTASVRTAAASACWSRWALRRRKGRPPRTARLPPPSRPRRCCGLAAGVPTSSNAWPMPSPPASRRPSRPRLSPPSRCTARWTRRQCCGAPALCPTQERIF